MEWSKKTYNNQYEKWVPWLEDKYLAWFGDKLRQTNVTGDKNIGAITDGVAEGVGGQFGKGGLGEGVGEITSKEVWTRSERQGKDDKGGYI
ncbi:hypothetical protein UCRPC4_g00380 [Phaeomoniella chlamydospora]|uniref:Uncharacterized protein n=1 Tax=Phaeomoniella chlamydospora TaxID=158046 RepID=A0A0G2F3G3_PHACM|nr:hypothetical protein UCRPC4_g00380 [Phaeomoniella chlamydospora]